MGASQPRITETDYYAFTMVGRLEQPTKHNKHTSQHNRRCIHATRLCPAHLHPTPRVLNHPPAAGGHRPRDHGAQPGHRQQPHTARAPAGHRSPIESWPFPRLPPHPPPLEHASPRSRVPTGSVVPSSALRSCCKVTGYALPAREAPPKSAIPPKPASSDSAHAYRMVPEAWARHHYSYAMDTVKDG